MKEVSGRLCFGYNKGARIPFSVRLEIHQGDCPHIDDPQVAEEELLDYAACLQLDEKGWVCPHAKDIKYSVGTGIYTCLCD